MCYIKTDHGPFGAVGNREFSSTEDLLRPYQPIPTMPKPDTHIVEAGGRIFKICNGFEYVFVDGAEPRWKAIRNSEYKVT